MLSDELVTYLAGAGLGLTAGTNLFDVPFPATAPDLAVALVEGEPSPSVDSFSGPLQPPDCERPEVLVLARAGRDAAGVARTLAWAVYKKLRGLGPTTLSGTAYFNIEARPPRFVDFDENGRAVFAFAADVWKAESA